MLEKLKILKDRFDELSDLLTKPDIISDQSRYIKISKEYKDLKTVVDKKNEYEEVLSNIKRQNISSEKLIELAPSLREQGLSTTSEIILGLPGETYETHIQTVRDVMRANIDWINIWTLMLLDGSELNTPKEREKWQLNVKYRIIPRDFTKLKNGKIVDVVVRGNS